jgi:hypothetical protein
MATDMDAEVLREPYDAENSMTDAAKRLLQASGTAPGRCITSCPKLLLTFAVVESMGEAVALFVMSPGPHQWREGCLLMCISALLNALGLVLHWKFAAWLRYQRPCAELDLVFAEATELTGLSWNHLVYLGPAFVLTMILGGYAWGQNEGWDFATWLVSCSPAMISYPILMAPHIATTLLLQSEFEAVSLKLEQAVGRQDVSRVVKNVIEITSRWRYFLFGHFLIEGLSIFLGIFLEIRAYQLIKHQQETKSYDVTNYWGYIALNMFLNHPLLNAGFLLMQFMALRSSMQQLTPCAKLLRVLSYGKLFSRRL